MTSEPRHSDERQSEIRDGAPRVQLIATAAWAAAAVVAGVAPFLDFYSYGGIFLVDGFGRGRRVRFANDGIFYGGGPSSDHAPRSGIALLAAAVLLLVGVVWSLGRAGRVAGLLGVVGSVAVVFAALDVLIDARAEASGSAVTVHAGVWLALAAGVLGVAGAVLGARAVLRAD